MNSSLKHLFAPIAISGMELKNRIVMPAMATGYANADSTISDRLIAYLSRRAAGGTGLIVTEVCAVDPRGKGFPNEIGVWNDAFIPGLARLTAALHGEGAKTALQLHHAGRETFAAAAGGPPEAPSAIPSVILNQPCEEMSPERIAQVIRAYADAAVRARSAGFDAVEVHGAHGYLITQFLSPFSNHRTDEYGGSEENRSRFVIDLLRLVREKVGADYPVLIRVSADEMIRGGYGLDFMLRLVPRLVEAGASAVHVSVGVYSTPGNLSIASMDTAPGFNLERAAAVKRAAGVPVIGVGRINDPVLADRAIARGDADLISMGRQHLTDPDLAVKAMNGRLDDIRYCVACNQGCIERLSFEMKSTTCTFNPGCGTEHRLAAPAAAAKRVWVIGAGPAGLSAALAAVARGHRVELYEKGPSAGGQLIPAGAPPHKEGFMQWTAWAVRDLAKRDVEVRCNRVVTEEMILAERPDHVILATGAGPSVPEIPGITGPGVLDARDVLTGAAVPAGPVVILGAGYVGMETADFCASRGMKAAIVEMNPFPPVGKHTAHGYWLHKRIRESGGLVMLGARVLRIDAGAVIVSKDGAETALEAGSVITALGARSESSLAGPLEKAGIPCTVVGDAKSPRRLIEAIHEGHRAGNEV
jgi:2,4-dienoyl-CoA reductase-like NADH-dependent reductase (Old Yellow Enzyme family)/ribulose 1,5-bisphosphate synthetase/thiazole synthase